MTTVPVQNFVMENDSTGFTGVFVDKVKIIAARSVSNEDIYKNDKPVDCGIEFTLDVTKKDGTLLVFGNGDKPKFTVAGNFKVENGMVTGTGSATGVKIALGRLQVKWDRLNPDNSIPQEVLDQCVGKEIIRLQYPYKKNPDTQKNQYRNFRDFFLASTPDAEKKLRQKYNSDVANGYVKPIQDEDISFPGSNGQSTSTAVTTEQF